MSDTIPGLTQIQHNAVERLFAQEFPGGTPATLSEITPATARALVAKGMAEERRISVGGGAMGGLRIVGHMLTVKGHLAYCEWAAEQPGGDEEAEGEEVSTEIGQDGM